MSIRKNTLINLAGAIVPMGVMLVTMPLYLDLLGEARYGVLALIWLVLGYFSFLEMGLGKATANQIAKAAEGAAAERSEIFWAALLINVTMGVVGAGILWLVGDYLLTSVLKMPTDFGAEAVEALPWMIATLPLALVSSVLNGALEGRNRFLTVNLLQILSNTVFQLAPLAIAYLYGPTLEVVIPAAVISRAAMNLPFLFACHRAVPFTFAPHFSTRRAKSLFSFGGWIALTGVVSPLMETLDRFLIGMILGTKAVTHYTIAYQLATKLRILPASLSRAVFPSFSAHSATASELALESFAGLIAVMTPVIALSVLLVEPFLTLWIGPTVAQHAAPAAQIILVGVWANSLAYIPLSLLQGQGTPGVVAKLHLAELLPFLAILYLATNEWGVIGAATAWTARVIVDSLLLFWGAGIARSASRKTAAPLAMVLMSLLIAVFANQFWAMFVFSLILFGWILAWLKTTPLANLRHGNLLKRSVSNAN